MKTQITFDHTTNYVKDVGISRTVPDQTMPLRTILERYARGLPINAHMNTEEDILEDGVNLKAMDLAERQSYFESKLQEYKALRAQVEEMRKKKIQDEEKRINELVNEKVKNLQQQKPEN